MAIASITFIIHLIELMAAVSTQRVARKKQAPQRQAVVERALLANEERYHSLLAATSDYVYRVTIDHGRSVATSHGAGCELITGFTSGEFAADPSLWYRMIHEDDRQAVLSQVDRIVKGESPFPLEHRIIHKNGDIRWIRNVPVPQRASNGELLSYNGLISDITELKRAERLLAVQYAVTRALAEAGTLPEALLRILKAICESCPWDWASFWAYNPEKHVLEWSEICFSPALRLEEFENASRSLSIVRDQTLPGLAWAAGEPIWVPDIVQQPDFCRASAAEHSGLHSGCAIPVQRCKEPVGVIEFFSRKVQPRDPHTIEMLAAISTQVGQFLERKWAENALSTEHNLLRTLIDNLPDYVFAKDLKTRFVMSNVSHVRALGAARFRDVAGKSDSDFFPPELAARYLADDEAVLQTGQPIFNRQEPVVNAEGQQQWVLTSKVPWKDDHGEIIGLIGVSRDITARQEADEKQRQSEARLQAILDNSPAVIYLKDLEGRYALVNVRFEVLFHIKREAVVGRQDSDLFPPAVAEQFRRNDQKVANGLGPIEFEEEVPAEDGMHTFISAKFPLISTSGRPYAVCGISTDISERKQAEEQLRKAYTELAENDAVLKRTVAELKATHDQLEATELQLIQAAKLECIGTLAAGVAHEVKNPLQTMLMGLHYLKRNLNATDGETSTVLQDMRDAVTRANTIICGLLELAADGKAEKKSEDLNECIERSLWLVRHELVAGQTTVVSRLGKQLPPVVLDRGKVEQVFLNIFMNSLQAMPHGGTISVTTECCDWSEQLASREAVFQNFGTGDRFAVVRVEDTGTGIPESKLGRIFDPFFTTKSVGQGTGLGLAVVKRIMALHGGAVDIRNASSGGVLVTLVLKL
jgi:PAS domain S-box-containing protein